MRTHQASQRKSSAQKSNAPTSNALESRPFAPQSQPEKTERSQPTKNTGNFLEIASRFSPIERRAMPLQPKLAIGQPGDKYEQEADRIAKQVVQRMNAPLTRQSHQQQTLQRQEMPESEDKLQMKPQLKIQRQIMPGDEDELQKTPMLQLRVDWGGMAVTPELEASIQRLRGSGQPLAEQIREPMEQAFGADFGGVKVHTDAQSDQLNRSIQAKAFTTGQDVFFRQGAYQPRSRGGQELIAHELTHVVQQNGITVQGKSGRQTGVIRRTQSSELNTADSVDSPELNREDSNSANDIESESEEILSDLQQRVMVDLDENEKDEEDENNNNKPELHLLFVNPEDGKLWLHSDTQTLESFIAKKRKKDQSQQVSAQLKLIEDAANKIHDNRYAKSINKAQRQQIQQELNHIALMLQDLKKITKYLNSLRPPSHKKEHITKKIGKDEFCEKIVMEPLSIMPRDDGIVGSSPKNTSEGITNLWRDLTQIAGYKRGHMLNEKLHGPGSNDNLVPISTAFNSTMREGVEKVTKQAVNAENKVVRFEAEALNWGQFVTPAGLPDEKKLPSEFAFSVTQMKRKTAGAGGAKLGDGSKTNDWENTTIKIYKGLPRVPHDPPNDYLTGITHAEVKQLKPGFYFCPSGKIKKNPNSNDSFYLKGNFRILDHSYLVRGLGLDETIRYEIIYELITAEYKLPTGFDIEFIPNPQKIELIGGDPKTIQKFETLAPAFIVFDSVDRKKRLTALEEEKKEVIEKQEQAQKQAKEQQKQQSHLKTSEQEKKPKQEEENKQKQDEQSRQQRELELEEQREREFQQKNDDFRRQLLNKIWNETNAIYTEDLDEKNQELFLKEVNDLLYRVNNEIWKKDEQLFEKSFDNLLDPVRNDIETLYTEIKEIEKHEQIKEDLLRGLKETAAQYLEKLKGLENPIEAEVASAYFKRKYETYNKYWVKRELKADEHESFRKSAEQELDEAFKEARSKKALSDEGIEKAKIKSDFLNKIEVFISEVIEKYSYFVYQNFKPQADVIKNDLVKQLNEYSSIEDIDVNFFMTMSAQLWNKQEEKLKTALQEAVNKEKIMEVLLNRFDRYETKVKNKFPTDISDIMHEKAKVIKANYKTIWNAESTLSESHWNDAYKELEEALSIAKKEYKDRLKGQGPKRRAPEVEV